MPVWVTIWGSRGWSPHIFTSKMRKTMSLGVHVHSTWALFSQGNCKLRLTVFPRPLLYLDIVLDIVVMNVTYE